MANNAPSPECEESPPPPKRSRYCELGVFFNKVIAEMPVYLRTPPGADSEYSLKRVLGADSPTDRRLVLVGAILKTLSEEERETAMSLCNKTNVNGLAVEFLKYMTKHPGRKVKVTDAMKARWSPEYIEEIKDCHAKGQDYVKNNHLRYLATMFHENNITGPPMTVQLDEEDIIIEEETLILSSVISGGAPRPRKLSEFFQKVIQELPIYLKNSDRNDEYSMKRVIGADSPTAHRLILVGAIVKTLSEEERFLAMTLSGKTDENGLAVELLKYMSKSPGRRNSIINSMKARWCDEFIDEIQDCYRIGQACVDYTVEYIDINGTVTEH